MKNAPTISDVLRRAIAESGIPLLTLEKETGVVRASIMRFVRGDQTIHLDAADRLAAYFGLTVVKKREAKGSARRRAD